MSITFRGTSASVKILIVLVRVLINLSKREWRLERVRLTPIILAPRLCANSNSELTSVKVQPLCS